jgi:putative SOS response-associated peptidase YedK
MLARRIYYTDVQIQNKTNSAIIRWMCGRFTLRTKLNILLSQFHAELRDDELELRPRYNIPPADGKRWAQTMHWGLLPSWTKDPKKAPLLNNARAETVAE